MSKVHNDVKRINGHNLDVFMATGYEDEKTKGGRKVTYEQARVKSGYSQSDCINMFLKQIPRKEALKVGDNLAFGSMEKEDKNFSIERSFAALKKIDRLVYDNYEELTNVSDWYDFVKEYSERIPFSMFLDNFCVHIKNVKMRSKEHPKHVYIHITRNQNYKLENVFYFTFHYYSEDLKHYFSPIIFEIKLTDMNLLKIFTDKSSVDGGNALSIDLRKSIEDNTNAILIREKRDDCFVMSLQDVNYIDHYAKTHNCENEPIPKYVASICIEQTIQTFYALCIIYKASVEMVLEKERREEYNRLRKENPVDETSGDEKRTYKSNHTTKNLEDHKVINLNKNLNMCVTHKSYKRVKTHFRRKCNYQYTVVGHYRHYKNGKTIFVKPYNKNTEKPFRGKEYKV